VGKKKNKSYTDRTRARIETIKRCIARGLHDNQIIDYCQTHTMFEYVSSRTPLTVTRLGRPHKRSQRTSVRLLTRNTIRSLVYKARREILEDKPTGNDEVSKAYNRLVLVYELALKKGELKNAVAAQVAINKMLGLDGKEAAEIAEAFTIDQLREQMQSMNDSVMGSS